MYTSKAFSTQSLTSYEVIISSQVVPAEASITNMPARLSANVNAFCLRTMCISPSSSTV